MRSTPFVTLTVLAGLGIAMMIDRLPVNSNYDNLADSSPRDSRVEPRTINGLRVSPCQTVLAFHRNNGEQRGRIVLERIASRERLARLSFGSRLVVCFEFVSSNRALIACYHDGSIARWQCVDEVWRHQLVGRLSEAIRCCATSTDGRRLAIGCDSGDILLCDLRDTKRRVQTLKSSASVACVRFSLCGNELFSGSSDRNLRVWNAGNGRLMATLAGHSGAIGVIKNSPNGRFLVSGDDDGMVIRWDRVTNRRMWSMPGLNGGIRSLGISPSRASLAVGTVLCGNVQLRDIATGELIASIAAHRSTVSGTEYLANGTLLTAGHDGEIHRFTPEELKQHSAGDSH